MPISDQVIELETKKTGRNILFIVLISVLAAASVVFAVLWVTKAPAVDPPAIDAIEIAYTDMCQTGGGTAEEPVKKFVVVPSQTYTVRFDVVLKENTELGEVNSLLDVYTEPVDMIQRLDSSGLNKDNPSQYDLRFNVKAAAHGDFTLVVTSKYTQELRQEFALTVAENEYVEYFDLVADEDNRKALTAVTTRDTILLQPSDTAQSTATALHYTADKELLYYEGNALSKKNQNYRLSFTQLGRSGLNGERAKIMTNKKTETGMFDQVQVFIADSADTPDAVYRELSADGMSNTENLNVLFRFDGNDYPRDALRFGAKRAGTSTIKLVANAYNGAPQQYEIYVQITFKSSDAFGKITEIVFTDPYTEKPTGTLDLYHDAIAGGKTFMLSDYISVKRGTSGNDEVHWGMNGLRGSIVQDNNNQLLKIDTNVSSGFAITADLPGGHKTGTATVTVRDTDPDGFDTELTLTVRVLAPIDNLTPKTATLTANSGANVDLNLTYTLPGAYLGQPDYAATLANLNRVLGVSYHEHQGKTLPAPTFANGAVNNRDKTVVPVGITSDRKVTPNLTRNGETNTFAAKVTLQIGKDVASGTYEMQFALQPQGFKDTANTPKDELRVTVLLNVTRLADTIGVQKADAFAAADEDKYTEISGSGNTATLTIGAGTGKQDTAGANNPYYTQFSLYDILKFVLNGTELQSPATREVNYERLKVTGDIAQVFKGNTQAALLARTNAAGDAEYGNARFIVPQDIAGATSRTVTLENGNYTLTLTVEYKLPVVGLSVGRELTNFVNISYGRAVNGGAEVLFDNLNKDTVKLQTVNGAEITDLTTIKHPEWLRIDVTVVVGGKAYRLPKKTVKTDEVNVVYYFALDTTDEQLKTAGIESSALFRTYTQSNTYTMPWKDQGVKAVRDLFAVSVEKGFDYQNVRLYYSYGKDELTGTADGNFHNYFEVQDTADNKAYIARANYKLIRHVDELFVYKSYDPQSGRYTDRIDEDSQSADKGVSVVSGSTFGIYVVREFEIGRAQKYQMRYGDTAYNCHAVKGFDITHNDGNVQVEHAGVVDQYRATCRGESGNAVVMFSTDCDTTAQKTTTLAVSVSNTVTRIQSIALYTDSAHNNSVTADTVFWLYKNGTTATVTIYYTVVYREYTDKDSALEEFRGKINDSMIGDNSENRVQSSTLPSFTTAPSAIDATQIEGLELSEKTFTYRGYITLGAGSLANGDYTFNVYNLSNHNVTATIRVTTLIDPNAPLQFSFIDDQKQQKNLKAGHTYDNVNFTFKIDNAAGAGDYKVNTSVDFLFDFQDTDADMRNLSYNVVLTKSDGTEFAPREDGDGRFYHDGTIYQTFALANGKTLTGYRLYLTNRQIENATMVITVTETAGTYSKTHTYTMKFTVHSSVAQIKVSQNGTELNNGTAERTYVLGQNADTFNVTLLAYKEGTITVNNAFTVESSKEGVAVVTADAAHKTFTVTITGAGDATITVSAGDQTFTFTVRVTAPGFMLGFEGGKTNYNVLDSNNTVGFTVGFTNGTATALPADFAVWLNGVKIAVGGTQGAFTLANGAIGGSYVLTFDKTKLTAADIKTHTLKVTGTVNGVEFTKEIAFTLIVAGYAPELTLSRTDGEAVTGNRVLLSDIAQYKITLANPLSGFGTGAVSVAFTPEGFTGSQSGNVFTLSAFTGNIASGGKIKVTVTVLGARFTQELVLSVAPQVNVSITAPAAGANGVGTYTITGIPDGVTFTSKAEIIAGDNLIELSGNNEANNSKTFTVTANTNTAGGTAVIKITVRITDSRFAGTECAAEKTFTYTVTVTGADKPNNTALTVQKTNETATGGELSVAVTGYTPASVSYTVTAGADYIVMAADGSYTYVKDTAQAHTVKVTVTAVIDHNVYGKIVLTKEAEITVPKKSAKPELQNSDITVQVKPDYTGTLVWGNSDLAKVVWLSKAEDVTVTGDTFAFTDSTQFPHDFTLHVYYKIVTGDWAGETVYEKDVTVSMPAFPTGSATIENGGDITSIQVYDATCEYNNHYPYIDTITCEATGENAGYITLTGSGTTWKYTFKNGAGGKTITLSFSARINQRQSAYNSYTITWTQDLIATDEPNPTVKAVGDDNGTQSLAVDNLLGITCTLTTTNNYFTLGENNTCVWKEDVKGDTTKPEGVTVTVTITSGVYSGCTYNQQVSVTVPAKTPASESTTEP